MRSGFPCPGTDKGDNNGKMTTYNLSGLTIEPEKQGADRYIKISYPLCYGVYGQIRTRDHLFGFNRNGEIKTIQGRAGGWLETAEWLKRSAGNDWAYFSAGGYNGAYNYTGEYYVPCLGYQTNTIFGHDKFNSREVTSAFQAWRDLLDRLEGIDTSPLPEPAARFIERIRAMPPEALEKRGKKLHAIIGGPVSVLPPDTRHVEYDVIPVTIADGCLYNCGFCRVKSGNGFRVRTPERITDQLHALKRFYGRDLVNYNSVFLGEHDALFAGVETVAYAAEKAFEILEIENSIMKEPRLFLFGSADAILRTDNDDFAKLNRLPFFVHINIGLESGDPETLAYLKKPLSTEKVSAAFSRMIEINRRFPNVEISANFVIGGDLPDAHLPSIVSLTRNRLDHFYPKGDIYLSPLENIGAKEDLLAGFNRFKILCRLPAYLYLIQRL